MIYFARAVFQRKMEFSNKAGISLMPSFFALSCFQALLLFLSGAAGAAPDISTAAAGEAPLKPAAASSGAPSKFAATESAFSVSSEDLAELKLSAMRYRQEHSRCHGQWSGDPRKNWDPQAFKKYINGKQALERANFRLQKAREAETETEKASHTKAALKAARTAKENAKEALSLAYSIFKGIKALGKTARNMRGQILQDKRRIRGARDTWREEGSAADPFHAFWLTVETSHAEEKLKEIAPILRDIEAAGKGAEKALLQIRAVKKQAEEIIQAIRSGKSAAGPS